jgi:hypothetical protein
VSGDVVGGRASGMWQGVCPVLRVLACVLCFGLAGLIWSLPWLRRRRLARAARCHVCAGAPQMAHLGAVHSRNGARGRFARAAADRDHPADLVARHIAEDGTVQPEPMREISPPEPWTATRSVLFAPISGVGVLGGWAMGMESCTGPPLLVMLWLPPKTSGGGSTLGDVFVAWMPPRGSTAGALSEDGYGIVNKERYLRYGPNISQRRVNEAELGLHASRHVDQWAVGTILAGPLAPSLLPTRLTARSSQDRAITSSATPASNEAATQPPTAPLSIRSGPRQPSCSSVSSWSGADASGGS